MYSESRVTRSKARSQGVSQFEELPLTSAKVRTTIKKPHERPAFYDVTNAERSVSGEGQKPSSPIKNLTADFEPAEVETNFPGTPSAAASPPKHSSVVLRSADASVLDTVLSENEKEPVACLHQVAGAETIPTGVPQAFYSAAKQDEVQPWTGSPSTNQDFDAGDQGVADGNTKELSVTADPFAEEFDSAVIATTLVQTPQSPLQNSVNEALPSLHGRKDEECADPVLNTSYAAQALAQEHDIGISASDGTPKQLLDARPSFPATISSTFATVRQPLLSKQSMTPDVPDTVVSQQIDAGHLLAESLTPKAAQPTPAGVASATAASRCHTSPSATMPFSPIPGAVGLLSAASQYFPSETSPDKTAVSEFAEDPLVPSTASPHALDAPTEEKEHLQNTDILDAVYLSESDAESAEDMGELAPFQQISEVPSTPQSSVVSAGAADDITEPSDIQQSPLTPRRLSSPAAGTADMPALDSAMASEAFGSPMQQIPGSAARSAGFSEMVYSASPADHDHGSIASSASEEAAEAWAGAKNHMPSDDTEGLHDRWQMDEDTAPMVSNTHFANVPTKVSPQDSASQLAQVSSQVHASPSYDPRSLKQLKKAVADKLAKKAAAKVQAAMAAPPPPPPTPAGLYESESDVDMSPGLVSTKQAQGADNDELCNALGSLEIQSAGKSKEPLRGLPVPQGVHIRFDDEGHAMSSPSTTQTRLRGVPAPRNSHIRFD